MVFNFVIGNISVLYKEYFRILIQDYSIQYLYQFSQPYIINQSIIVSEIPGLVYFELNYKKTYTLNVKNYDFEYSWFKDYDIIYKGNKRLLFCIVGNNQYNNLDLKFNYNHKLGLLLKETEKTSYSKRFVGSFQTNITLALQLGNKLERYVNYDGGHHIMFNNNVEPFSLKTIQFMKMSFIDELNASLIKDLLNHLANENFIEKSEIADFLLSEKDFPEWWIEK